MIPTSQLEPTPGSYRFGSWGEQRSCFGCLESRWPGRSGWWSISARPLLMWLSAWMSNGLSASSGLEGITLLGSWRPHFTACFKVNEAPRCWQGYRGWPFGLPLLWAGFFGADSHWFAPSSGRAISGILAGWQMVKSLMLEVRREWWQATFGPVGKLQGLIITHQETPIWRNKEQGMMAIRLTRGIFGQTLGGVREEAILSEAGDRPTGANLSKPQLSDL